MTNVFAEEQDEEEEGKLIPDSAVEISKENTYPNPTQDLPRLKPSELADELLQSTEITIENPELIKIFNESAIKGSKLGFDMNVSIYLGQWPLAYESDETKINWDFEKVNTNMVDNRGGKDSKKISYSQEQQKRIKGGLTAEVPNGDTVQKMMMIKAMEKTNLPLSFSTVIGYGTKAERVYNVPAKTMGYLTAFAPAVNEKGKVTYGEVYLRIKRDNTWLEVKNVTQQGIGAWIPIQDHINLKLQSTNQPR
ncbi:YfkD famly protein [Evansella halocellulosilytica]|uniref:YfkD famly protein n=1 Tax=Evansella halocellulosilytica TaxID=2011013 RepID=UPI000BB6A400|nr:YfkD famly protein [Evansella halocellulosilytica]